jgi:hypothetical protein
VVDETGSACLFVGRIDRLIHVLCVPFAELIGLRFPCGIWYCVSPDSIWHSVVCLHRLTSGVLVCLFVYLLLLKMEEFRLCSGGSYLCSKLRIEACSYLL